MLSIFLGSLLISILHAIIPNHWLPVLAIGRKHKWDLQEITRVTLLAGFAHALSTIAIGIVIGLLGLELAQSVRSFTHFVAPSILILLGFFFIYQHHRHKHFHLHQMPAPSVHKNKIIGSLALAMFLSPCLEIEAYFLLAGSKGWWAVIVIAIIYFVITVSGMVLWVRLAYRGILKMNWHNLEHKAGIITGWTLVLSGILSFIIF